MLASSSFKSLKLDHVSRSFGSMKALNDVNLEIPRGEFVALLGPSGCGKSTALNCIAGLLDVTAGAILLDDKRIDLLRPEERGFGMVFQNYALFPHMTVRKNVGFGLKMRGVGSAEADKRSDEALRLVRLESQAAKLPGQLSGGQQQRVAIARAIVVEPPLVLMDEPLSNLDAKLRLEMRAEIRRIHQSLGSTTIYVTHDQDEALSLADRIVVMRDGQIRQVGTPEDLYIRPAHLDVAEFMGFRNRVPGKIVAREGDGKAGALVTVQIGDSMVKATLREPIAGESAVLAVRPDDLEPAAAGVPATVETMEYRGKEFVGTAKGPSGSELVFRSHTRLANGTAVHLAAEPSRALVYSGMAA